MGGGRGGEEFAADARYCYYKLLNKFSQNQGNWVNQRLLSFLHFPNVSDEGWKKIALFVITSSASPLFVALKYALTRGWGFSDETRVWTTLLAIFHFVGYPLIVGEKIGYYEQWLNICHVQWSQYVIIDKYVKDWSLKL